MSFDDVTAVCIDTRNHGLAATAASICASKCDFREAFVLSDIETSFATKIIQPILSIPQYNEFILDKLVDFVETDFVLVFQWDGFVINPDRWSDSFKLFDFIGAPWNEADVGNGGFSLRSRRLLERTKSMTKDYAKNEDGVLRWDLMPKLIDEGFACAPVELARQFSFEILPPPMEGSFGFHGDFNFSKVLDEKEFIKILSSCPDFFWTRLRPFQWLESLVLGGNNDLFQVLMTLCEDTHPNETEIWLKSRSS